MEKEPDFTSSPSHSTVINEGTVPKNRIDDVTREEKDARIDGPTKQTITNGDNSNNNRQYEYPTGIRLFFVTASLVLSVFLVVLDMTIVATAIPKITDEFRKLNDISWYGSAFFMCVAAFQSTCEYLGFHIFHHFENRTSLAAYTNYEQGGRYINTFDLRSAF